MQRPGGGEELVRSEGEKQPACLMVVSRGRMAVRGRGEPRLGPQGPEEFEFYSKMEDSN